MSYYVNLRSWKVLIALITFSCVGINALSEAGNTQVPVETARPPSSPPVPVETFFGNEATYFQLVFKKRFAPDSHVSLFSLATYTAYHEDEVSQNSFVTINQVSYSFNNGFGFMGGADMNSATGISAIVGPQHNYSSKSILAVTVASFFLNEDHDFKIFGLYEFKPAVSEKWSLYSRLQFIYNQNLSEGTHNRSYLYLRAGLKKGSLIFGLAANLDQFGPQKRFQDNYGAFVRWEFR